MEITSRIGHVGGTESRILMSGYGQLELKVLALLKDIKVRDGNNHVIGTISEVSTMEDDVIVKIVTNESDTIENLIVKLTDRALFSTTGSVTGRIDCTAENRSNIPQHDYSGMVGMIVGTSAMDLGSVDYLACMLQADKKQFNKVFAIKEVMPEKSSKESMRDFLRNKNGRRKW